MLENSCIKKRGNLWRLNIGVPKKNNTANKSSGISDKATELKLKNSLEIETISPLNWFNGIAIVEECGHLSELPYLGK